MTHNIKHKKRDAPEYALLVVPWYVFRGIDLIIAIGCVVHNLAYGAKHIYGVIIFFIG